MSFAAGASGGLALFNMWSTSKQIEKNNQMAVDAYNLQEASITFAQQSNWLNAMYAAEEMKRVSAINVVEAKPEIQQGASKVAMSEGVTVGNSKARMVQTYFLQAGQALGKQEQATESAVNKLAMGVENTNMQLQQQKMTAYNNMKASLITGNNAAFKIVGAGLSGGVQGAQLGSSFGATSTANDLTKAFNDSMDTLGNTIKDWTSTTTSMSVDDYNNGYKVSRY